MNYDVTLLLSLWAAINGWPSRGRRGVFGVGLLMMCSKVLCSQFQQVIVFNFHDFIKNKIKINSIRIFAQFRFF